MPHLRIMHFTWLFAIFGGLTTAGIATVAVNAADPAASCMRAVTYRMPEGVELRTSAAQDRPAPAELPGSGADVQLPAAVSFPLRVDPLKENNPELARRFDETSLTIGTVMVQRDTASVSIDGAPVSDREPEDVLAACARAKNAAQ